MAAAQADFAFSEAQKSLQFLNTSPYESCSDEEIAYLRETRFPITDCEGCRPVGRQSRCLLGNRHEARVWNGATRRAPERRHARSQCCRQHNRRRHRRSRTTVHCWFAMAAMLCLIPTVSLESRTDSTELTDHNKRPAGAAKFSAQVAASAIDRFKESSGRVGNTMYATRCSPQGLHCATATTTIGAALHGEAALIPTSAFGGGMAGILVGFAFSFRYRRRRELKASSSSERPRAMNLPLPISRSSILRRSRLWAQRRWRDGKTKKATK